MSLFFSVYKHAQNNAGDLFSLKENSFHYGLITPLFSKSIVFLFPPFDYVLNRNNDECAGEDSARTLKGKMVNRFVVTELRQKRKLMGHLGVPGREEIYCDKDRAAAVAMGDQDIKTSLKVMCNFFFSIPHF